MFDVVVVDVAEVVISVAVDTLEVVDSVVLVEEDLPMLVVDVIVEVGDDVLARVVVGNVNLVVRSDIVVVEDRRVVLDVVGSKVVVVVGCFMVDDGANVVGVNVLSDVDVFVIRVGEVVDVSWLVSSPGVKHQQLGRLHPYHLSLYFMKLKPKVRSPKFMTLYSNPLFILSIVKKLSD